MNNSNETRKKLYEQLRERRGSIKKIAERCKCSRDWVRRVLNEEYNDDDVLKHAAEVLNDRKLKEENAKTLIALAVA